MAIVDICQKIYYRDCLGFELADDAFLAIHGRNDTTLVYRLRKANISIELEDFRART